ncbi:uncharacterized protein LOC144749913 [Ciona intestinalis]
METLHQQMKQMFNQDFSEYDFPARPMSVDDKKALEKMEASVSKVRGHYQVALPWKDEERVLPNSREMAIKRLMSPKKRFVRDPRLHHMYNLKTNEYLSSGYAVVVRIVSVGFQGERGTYRTMQQRENSALCLTARPSIEGLH